MPDRPSDVPDAPSYPPVAIIGLACRFPGAPDAARFWHNLREGVCAIRTLDASVLRARGVPDEVLAAPGYVRAAAELDDVDKFDAAYFGMSPREASVMDPAHRFFLEVAHHALEHAGHAGGADAGAVGVFASSGAPTYLLENLRENPELMRSLGAFLVRHTGNDMNFLATRASYALDLRGPSLNVQTACSSSLVAVHLACQSLARGECDLALAGGSTIVLPMGHGYQHVEGEVLSPDGRCRPFDAEAAGTVFGSGTGCVVLKLLARALDDGDTIHAVVRGSAINNDGALKVGYLAPGVDGQAAAVRAALRAGGVDPASVSYVETHGTGTRMGDPIEVAALSQALGGPGARPARCGLGSVKSNIGHLGEAAGIASLIKAVLALAHRELPRTLGFTRPNPELALAHTPFYVQAERAPWTGPAPLRCGVSALGVGGTNCHVVLEQAPEPLAGQGARPLQLLLLSARDPAALSRLAAAHAAHLAGAPAPSLADAAYTLAVGRRAHPVREALVVRGQADAAAQLRTLSVLSTAAPPTPERAARVVLMFPGAGPQHRGMGARLYASEPVYRDAVDACIAIAEQALGPGALSPLLTEHLPLAARAPLAQPTEALPALFAVEYALARLYLAWGVAPSALIGHSMGEYVAACVAEVMTLREALELVILRARLSESVGGAMLSVALDEGAARALVDELGGAVDVAAINAPSACVLSGPTEAIAALEARLAARGVDCARLSIGLAAHSACLDPVLPAFRAACRRIDLRPPRVPLVSSLTGALLSAADARDPEYWVRHFRGTVQFARGIASQLADDGVFLELGPGRSLASLVRQQGLRARAVLTSLPHAQEDGDDLAHALRAYGRLWAAGAPLELEALYDGQLRNRVPLPGYPFARTRHWVEPAAAAITLGLPAPRASGDHAPAARPLDAWFEQVVYREAPRVSTARTPRRWLLLVDDARVGERLARVLPGDAFVVTPGTWLQRTGARRFALEVPRSACYDELLRALAGERFQPDHVVYALGAGRAGGLAGRRLRTLERALFGLTFLARALGRQGEPVQLSVLTHGVAEVDGGRLHPLAATALGPVLVTPREYGNVRTRLIDLPAPLSARAPRRRLVAIAEELSVADPEQVVALRRSARWARAIVPASLPEPPRPRSWLRPDSVVVVTGGLGGLALELCLYMARGRSLKLALIGRSASGEGVPQPSEARAQKLAALRALGAEVLVLSADVADRAGLKRALAAVRARFGAIDGVVHAAGVLDDELMETRALPAMQRVLAPKLEGARLLDRLIPEPLAFFVVFSSVASLLGLPGQVDYTAANAYLDAFARARSARAAGVTRVINWSAWREVGMTADALLRERAGAPQSEGSPRHPALDGWARAPGGGSTFTTTFRITSHWLLAEHRIEGASPLLSGTALIELTRAAAEQAGLDGPLELANVQFHSPFQVPHDGARTLSITLTPLGAGFEAVLATADDLREGPHATADVRRLIGAAGRPLDLAALGARCTRHVEEPRGGVLLQGPVQLGPRWANLVRAQYGDGEALLALQLPARFAGDLAHYQLHPALLDMATGGAQRLIAGRDPARDFYVPVGYGSLRMHAPLPARLFSHLRVRPSADPSLAHFDVTLAAPDGRVLVEITRFTLKRLDPGARLTALPSTGAPRSARGPSALEAVLAQAIAPADGVAAFERIMAQPGLVQVVASSVDLAAWQARLAGPRQRPMVAPATMSPATLAPSSGASEQQLAALWAELLGVAQVGADADFFELGGSSLLAVRLFARVNKQFGVALPLSTLFAAPTVRGLAKVLDEAASPLRAEPGHAEGSGSLVAMQPKGARPPFYCAAGMHGNPLNLRLLAAHLGTGQPFFGLQPQGLDGARPLHRTVPEMAAHYVRALRRHQPRGPYYLGGYSGGGIVAFEMARQLVAARAEVGALVLLDAPAPSMPQRPPLDRLKLHLARIGAHGPGYPARVLAHHLGARVDGARLRAHKLASRFVPELRFRYLLDEVAEAWLSAARAYRPEGYAGRALLLRAEDDGGELSGTATIRDAQNGWGAYLFGGLEVRSVPGDHATMCEEPNVRVLARHLAAYLERCVGERTALRARAGSSVAAE